MIIRIIPDISERNQRPPSSPLNQRAGRVVAQSPRQSFSSREPMCPVKEDRGLEEGTREPPIANTGIMSPRRHRLLGILEIRGGSSLVVAVERLIIAHHTPHHTHTHHTTHHTTRLYIRVIGILIILFLILIIIFFFERIYVMIWIIYMYVNVLLIL